MTPGLRVLLLCDRLDIAGGVERFVCTLANHLCSEGLDVAVGSVSTPRILFRYPVNDAVRVLCGESAHSTAIPAFAGGRLVRARRLLRMQWKVATALSSVMRSDQPDVVVLNGLTTACSVLVLDRQFAQRTICCDHNHFGARSALWQRLRRWLYPKVGAVVSLTQSDAQLFSALNPHTRTIYNASSLRLDSPQPHEPCLVLAVGRHVAQKGFDLLLKSWPLVVAALPQARLRIIGDGPLLDEHRSLVQGEESSATIEWLAPTNQIEHHYRKACVFVLSSRYEGMPLALLEAQAMGVPAVAFDCPTGPSEILTESTGRLVPKGDVDAMARALIEVLASRVLRDQMARAAIVRSRELFSQEEHLRRWTQLVREVALRNAYGEAVVTP